MEKDVVMNWLDELMNACGVSNLEDVPIFAIEAEIREAEANIQNMRLWGDHFGIACNEAYIETLNDTLERCKNDSTK